MLYCGAAVRFREEVARYRALIVRRALMEGGTVRGAAQILGIDRKQVCRIRDADNRRLRSEMLDKGLEVDF